MDVTLFEQLLHEEEGATLDFKVEQYRFAKATDEEKSELLKDIVGLANAWRRADAYILIGVKEVRGGRSKVVGVAHHLDDHALQQFVVHLTNRPVQFSYKAFSFDGKQVGVIKVDLQPRPVYLQKDFGKLRKHEVYVRRGSSTDPSRPATPEEIASMGAPSGSHVATPQLAVEFAETDRDRVIGPSIKVDVERWTIPFDEIPDLSDRASTGPFGIDVGALDMYRSNRNYYRDFAHYQFVRNLFRSIRLVVSNVGSTAAGDVRVVLQASTKNGVAFLDSSDIPDRPQRRTLGYDISALPNIRRARRDAGDIEVTKDDEESRVEADCGVLQPKRKVWSESFYVGAGATGKVDLAGLVYASNLPEPYRFALTVIAGVRVRKISVRRLLTLADRPDQEDVEDSSP